MNNRTNSPSRISFTSQPIPNGSANISNQTNQISHQIMHAVSSASGIPTSTTIKTISTGGTQNQSHPQNIGGATQTLVIKNQTVSLPAGLVSSAPSGLVTMAKSINQSNQAINNMIPTGVVMGVRPQSSNQKNVNSSPLSRVVIGNTHMVGTRPTNPAITLSSIQQSGPALILKTENGYQLLRVGPAQPGSQQATNVAQQITNINGNQTIRLQTVPAVSRISGSSLALRKTILNQQLKQKQNSMTVSTPGNIINSVSTSSLNQINNNTCQSQSVVTSTAMSPVLQNQQFNQQTAHHPQSQLSTQVQTSVSPQINIQQSIINQQLPNQSSSQQQSFQIQTNSQSSLSSSSGIQSNSNATVQQKSLQGNTKEKCRKFLANLIELSTREPKPVERNVRTLIQELIDSNVEPEEFCDRLERLLNASPQPCLIGFLKKSLPLLRQSLFSRELVIDGIRPPPPNVVASQGIQQQFPRIQAQIRPIGQTTTIGQTQVRMVSQTPPRPIGQTTITKQNITTGSKISGLLSTNIGGPKLVTSQIRSLGANDNSVPSQSILQAVNRFTAPQNIASVKIPQSGMRVPSNVQIKTSTSVRAKNSLSTINSNLNNITQVKVGQTQIKQITQVPNGSSLVTSSSAQTSVSAISSLIPPAVATSQINSTSIMTNILTNSNNNNVVNFTNNNAISTITTAKIITVKAQSSSQSTPKTVSKKKHILEEKAPGTSFFPQPSMSAASSMYGDDDINDVAAMGGVNLAEESQKILGSTENIGTQIRSCKDEVFLHLPSLQNKIKNLISESGLEDSSHEVAILISHACQERLKNVVEKLAVIAEHRIDILKIDTRYEITKDIRGQIKFLEELDKAEQKRHEEQEREMLFRAAKSRSKIEDPEQAKLKAKAKEMQRAEMEEIRHQESNKTALQAIGPPRKKTKYDGDILSTGSQSSVFGVGSNGIPSTIFRPRIKRVNIRDMLFFMEQERETCRSLMLYKSFLK